MPLIGVLGKVEVHVRDASTGRIVKKLETRNTLTNALIPELIRTMQSGRNRFLFRAPEFEARSYWYMALGTGVGTPSPSDTDLFAVVEPSVKHGSLMAYPDAGSVMYWVRYLPEDANGYTFTEVGVYDMVPYSYVGGVGWVPQPYTSGSLINHALLPEPIYKTGTILLDVYVTIQLSIA